MNWSHQAVAIVRYNHRQSLVQLFVITIAPRPEVLVTNAQPHRPMIARLCLELQAQKLRIILPLFQSVKILSPIHKISLSDWQLAPPVSNTLNSIRYGHTYRVKKYICVMGAVTVTLSCLLAHRLLIAPEIRTPVVQQTLKQLWKKGSFSRIPFEF